MKENKTSRYFKYAIGEIILVVMGILIALQINNWNEHKKKRAYEINMLTEISNALDNDITHYKRMIKRMHSLDSASTVFLNHIHNKTQVFEDSLYRNGNFRWYYLRTGILYQYNSGPYEALKSSGLDKISNHNLRNTLIDFYDFMFPYNAEMILYSESNYTEQIKKLYSFLGKPYTENVEGKIEVYKKFPKDLFQNIEFLELVNDLNMRAKRTENHLKRHLPKMEHVRQDIKNELLKK